MLIANPIYDTAFKRLMENDRVARFFIGTILGCKVISLEPNIQERTKLEAGQLTLYRKDFSATIETEEDGKKRVIIEMQKALHLSDIYRFREYLGGEYAQSKLPIIAIYILGFNLAADAPAFVAYPELRDLRTNEKLNIRDNFVEHLTHKAYFVQAQKIKHSFSTKLDKLLSIFEQANFVTKDKTMIEFPSETGDPDIKEMLGVLHYVAVDEKTRKELDEELYYQRYVEQTFGDKLAEIEKKDKEIEKQKEEMQKQKEEMQKQKKEIASLRKELEVARKI
jgi:hypothetical protein